MKALERRIGRRRGATRAPTQGPEWPGRLRPPQDKSDPPLPNLLRAKNGLDNGGHFRVEAIQADVVVLTQACDLENRKVNALILCPHMSLETYRRLWDTDFQRLHQRLPKEKDWTRECEHVREGHRWNLAMLNRGETAGLRTATRIVDFHQVFTVPREFLESFLTQRGGARIRLLPPYREHLSQAFARFFMRVGLPTPIQKDW